MKKNSMCGNICSSKKALGIDVQTIFSVEISTFTVPILRVIAPRVLFIEHKILLPPQYGSMVGSFIHYVGGLSTAGNRGKWLESPYLLL